MTTKIESAAAILAEMKQAAEVASAALVEAEAGRTQVEDRIAKLEAERSAILVSRKAGLTNTDDGSRLALLAADIENLNELKAEADAAVAAARVHVQAATGHVNEAQRVLNRERDAELLARLVEHAGKVDAIMLKTIRDIDEVSHRLGVSVGREKWCPSVALAESIWRRNLTRENRR